MNNKSTCVGLLVLAVSSISLSQVNVVTNRNDTHRTGANLNETVLRPSNVAYGAFGKIGYKSLIACSWTEPLLISNINVGGKVRNVLYVVTSNLDVYAFDADDMTVSAPLWHKVLTTLPKSGQFGIQSTPVIDPASGTLYAVTRTLEGPSNVSTSYVYRLWGVNIYTGAILPASGQTIAATATGTGDNTNGSGSVVFDAQTLYQRAALLLSNGFVYIGFGSAGGDVRPYHGWLLSYNASTLAQSGAYCVNPNSAQGGIWGAGCGPAADDNGYIYVATGNGTKLDPASYLGDSVLKFSADGQLTLVDYFAPYNKVYLDKYDLDIGVTGPVCIPGTTQLVVGSKQGKLYSIDEADMGHLATNASNETQAFDDEIHGSPVYYNGSTGPTIYCWGMNDYLKAFSVANGSINPNPVAQSSFIAAQGDPGGFLSLTANSTDPTSAILWSNMPYYGDDANSWQVPGVLRSFNPYSLTEIWNSYANLGDDTGFFAKNVPPLVANGKVYMVNDNSTTDNRLNIYGLLNLAPPQSPIEVSGFVRDGVNRLFWYPSPNTSTYTVYRSISSTKGFSSIAGGLTANSYIDKSMTPKTTYYYYATASNAVGTSPESNVAAINYAKSPAFVDFSYPSFSSTNSFVCDGGVLQTGSQFNLTNGTAGSAGALWYSTEVIPDEFSTTFTFQCQGPSVDGLTFTVQYAQEGNRTTTAVGAGGSELGYGPDPVTGRGVGDSVGIKFVNGGPGASSTGILYLGRDTGYETDSLSGTGIDFSTGDTFQAQITYNGITLTSTITDLVTSASSTHSYVVSIPAFNSNSGAYVGLTGSAETASTPAILSWTFSQ